MFDVLDTLVWVGFLDDEYEWIVYTTMGGGTCTWFGYLFMCSHINFFLYFFSLWIWRQVWSAQFCYHVAMNLSIMILDFNQHLSKRMGKYVCNSSPIDFCRVHQNTLKWSRLFIWLFRRAFIFYRVNVAIFLVEFQNQCAIFCSSFPSVHALLWPTHQHVHIAGILKDFIHIIYFVQFIFTWCTIIYCYSALRQSSTGWLKFLAYIKVCTVTYPLLHLICSNMSSILLYIDCTIVRRDCFGHIAQLAASLHIFFSLRNFRPWFSTLSVLRSDSVALMTFGLPRIIPISLTQII